MVFKKDKTRINNFSQFIIAFASLTGVIAVSFYCGNFYAEYHYDKKEDKHNRTIDSLNEIQPLTIELNKFFPKDHVIYMGWLKEVEWDNINAVSLDTTEDGDFIPFEGKNCRNALGMHSKKHGQGYAQYSLYKRCSYFIADLLLVVPIKKEHKTEEWCNKYSKGVRFSVYEGYKKNKNAKPLFETVIKEFNKPYHLKLSIDSVQLLHLEVETMEEGDNSTANSAWANARVIVR
jgi:hypothetical protein